MKCVSVPASLVEATIIELRAGGAALKERLVLWAGHPGPRAQVSSVIVPPQEADIDFFHVPPAGMREVFDALRPNRLAILAQVHSHPEDAFHSSADDDWAIVRYVGALSIVLPYFASTASATNFLEQAAIFVLSSYDVWHPLARRDVRRVLEIAP
jgi:hypothetical protein